MPKIVPSQVVAGLNALVPATLRAETSFDRDSGVALVAPLFAMYRKLSEEHFALMAPDDYFSLGRVAGQIEGIITQWHNADAKELRLSGGPKLSGAVLRQFANLLAKATDQGASVPDNTLAFMWESKYIFRPTKFALAAPQLQKGYDAVWSGFKKRFK